MYTYPLSLTHCLLIHRYRLFNSTVSGDGDVDLRRSGVGGYQNGLPLLAGKLVEQVETPYPFLPRASCPRVQWSVMLPCVNQFSNKFEKNVQFCYEIPLKD